MSYDTSNSLSALLCTNPHCLPALNDQAFCGTWGKGLNYVTLICDVACRDDVMKVTNSCLSKPPD